MCSCPVWPAPGICAGPSSLIILFILLILVLSWPLAEPCSVLNQSYAGGLQAFLHCRASAAITEARAMNRAMEALEAWMSSNRLRLNPSKTQFIWLGTRQQLAKIDLAALATEFPQFAFSTTVRDLGVTIDQELTFARHIHQLCRDCYYQLRQLRVVSRSLTTNAASTLIHSFVVTRLDLCCALYAGLPAVRLGCLERVLRTAARLIGHIPKFGHVTAFMRDVLHWLPIPQRIVYRLSALVWRCLLGSAPVYLQELCRSTLEVQGRRALRSSTHGELLVPRVRTALRQHRAFSVAGPMVCNGLPLTLRLIPRVHLDAFYSNLKPS